MKINDTLSTAKQNVFVRELVTKKYIDPIRRPRTGLVGVEFELPIVNLQDAPVDFTLIHKLTDVFAREFHFTGSSKDDDGEIYLLLSEENGDTLSYDCSYNTLEFSFHPEDSLVTVYDRFVRYYSFVQEFLLARGHSLTGMGINPHWNININEPIHNPRYRMLFHHLQSYPRYEGIHTFHSHPNFGLFSCASQLQIDTDEENVLKQIRVFSLLEPIKALLFSNSVFEDYLCARDYLWQNSTHGINPHNLGSFAKIPETIDELTDYICAESMYCLYRDDKYMNFAPTPLTEYYSAEKIHAEYYNGTGYEEIEFAPHPEDLSDLRSFKFVDLTFRGTLELRSVCEQPVREIMAPSAFQAGINANLDAAGKILDEDPYLYHCGLSAAELRDLFVRQNFRAAFAQKTGTTLDEKAVSALALKLLDAAAEGLNIRGYGEERFLTPLYSRAEHLNSPAAEMLAGMQNGKTMNDYIHDYAQLV